MSEINNNTNNTIIVRCKRCGRILKNLTSAKNGYGPLCLKKIGQVKYKEEIGQKLILNTEPVVLKCPK